jgi:hypothetical protein
MDLPERGSRRGYCDITGEPTFLDRAEKCDCERCRETLVDLVAALAESLPDTPTAGTEE